MLLERDNELTYKIAFSMTPGTGSHLLVHLEECDVSLEEFFKLSDKELNEALRLKGHNRFESGTREEALIRARKELDFMNRHHIRGIFIRDDEYPQRMAICSGAPLMLYCLGDCSLNSAHSIGVVGTRRLTPQGADIAAKIVRDLSGYFPDLCVWSGLAYGADAVGHITALDENRMTVAVLAHGLQTIYPAAHRELAKRIINSGGALVTEYPSGTSAYRGHFLERNRIVAWATDATVVIESEIKGGAMSTANYAFHENRDVLAVPGRVSDPMSAGCNHLIRINKASLVTSAADVIEATGWKPAGIAAKRNDDTLFPEVTGDSETIFNLILQSAAPLAIDEIHASTRLPISVIMGSISEMEFDGIIIRHPGNRFSCGAR